MKTKLFCFIAFLAMTGGSLFAQSELGGGSSSGGGGGIGPITTAWYASPNCTNGATNCTLVNANTHWVCDATTTGSSNIVTAPDANFTTTAKVGQVVWAVVSNCNQNLGALALAETTILSVDSNTQIHTTANAASSVSANAMLIWGTLDTPTAGNCGTGVDNVKTATNAALALGVSLYLPSGGGAITTGGSGGIMVECSEFQAPTAGTTTNPFNLIGHVNSYIFATPNFDFTSVPAGNAGALGTFNADAQSMLPNVSILRDVAFLCGGFSTWGTGVNTHPILSVQRVVMTNVTGWGCGPNGITEGLAVTGPSTIVGGFFYNFGGTACESLSTGQNQTVVFTGNGYCAGPTAMALSGTGNWTASYGTFFQSFNGTASINMAGTSQILNSYGDVLECENSANDICLRNTGAGNRANFDGSWIYTTSETAPAFGIVFTGNGAVTSFHNTTIQADGGIAISGASSAAVYNDQGYNQISGGTICASSLCSWIGEVNSSNQVLVTAAKLVLSAGWGSTAANTSLTGGNAPIQFTITNSGTGQGASPTITYTFPTAYIVAPFSCTATQTGGTNATGTFTSSALSTTGVTFTFSLTPTASSTEIVQVQCVTP